jgi:hypothetical protein
MDKITGKEIECGHRNYKWTGEDDICICLDCGKHFNWYNEYDE